MSQTDILNNFTVGEIEVSPQHNMLRNSSQALSVQPKVMAVLCYLAKNQARVVSNEELLDSVWRGRVVTLASVQKSINSLRTALADLAHEQEFVTYFSKRGYQLIQPVTWLDSNTSTHFNQNTQAPTATGSEEGALEETVLEPNNHYEITLDSPYQQASHLTPQRSNGVNKVRIYAPRALAAAIFAVICVVLFRSLQQPAPLTHESAVIPVSQPAPAITQEPANTPNWQTVRQFLPSPNAHHATPNPDGKRAAYLIETDLPDNSHQSDLMIRDNTGLDWLLARSNSTWVDLAWSPSGRALAALEILRADGVLSDPDFYQTPQYLYNFHLFTLDLKGQHLLEKNLLSQWQGKVNSITWWDENTLEFVASMGANMTKSRYRYSLTDQTLVALPSTSDAHPLVSRIHNKKTAILSSHQDKKFVEFLDEQQQIIGQQTVANSIGEIAWLPQTQTIVALDSSKQTILLVPQQGSPSNLDLPASLFDKPVGALSDLKFDSSGKSLLVTATEQPRQLFHVQGQTSIPIGGDLPLNNNAITYSPDGGAWIYGTRLNRRNQIWRITLGPSGAEKAQMLFEIDGVIEQAIWPATDYLLVKNNGSLSSFQLSTGRWSKLIDNAQDIEPLGFNPTNNTLSVIKTFNDVRNIWRANLATTQFKQLTFGEVGSARSLNNEVYFQYANQRGLWKLNVDEPNHLLISDQFPQYSQILGRDERNIYFVFGGPCHESAIHQLNTTNQTITSALKRPESSVISYGLSGAFGILQSPCTPMNYTSYEIRQEP